MSACSGNDRLASETLANKFVFRLAASIDGRHGRRGLLSWRRSSELTFSQPVACQLGPMRLPGTPPVFYSSARNRHMPKKPTPFESPSPDDGEPAKQHARIDINPPYPANPPRSIHNFQKLLAELIARRFLADRDGPSDTPDNIND
jgi:hypothetical protein